MAHGGRLVFLLSALLALLHGESASGQNGGTPISAAAGVANAAYERPQLAVQVGHSRNVLAVAYSPDGRTALTGGDDQTARLWDIVTAKEIRRFEGHSAAVVAVAFSADGRSVLTGGSDATARLWVTATGEEIRRFEHADSVRSVAFSPDGREALSAGLDGKARLWDVKTGEPLRIFEGHDGPLLAAAFSSDGRRILSGSGDTTARLWDARTARLLLELKGHSEPIVSVAFSPDGTRLLTGSLDRTARMWDAASGGELQRYQAPRRVLSAAFSPDGLRVITGNEGFPIALDGDQSDTVRVWDAERGTQLRSLRPYGSSAVSIAVSADGREVLVGAEGNSFSPDDGRAQVWDVDTGIRLRTLEGQGVVSVECVVLSEDGRLLLFGGDDGAARLWDASIGREIQRFQHDSGGVSAVALSADAQTVLTGGDDCTARLWNAQTGAELRRYRHEGSVVSVALSPDGRSVATGSTDSTARHWDAATGNEIRRLVQYTGQTVFVNPIYCTVAFSPDGRSILTGQWDHTARLWDATGGQELRSFEGHEGGVVAVAFSADGKQVLTGSRDKTARLWDVETGAELRSLSGHSGAVRSVALSPDGKRILTGSADRTARLWNAESGTELRRFSGHAGVGQSVGFAQDGKRAVTAGLDRSASLWDAETGRPICTLIGCGRGTVVATPEGYYLASKGALRSVAFASGNRAFSFDQFDLKFNRPDLVLAAIGAAPAELVAAYRGAYLKRLAKLGFTEERLGGDFHLPEIAILSEHPLWTTEKKLTLSFRARDSQSALDRVNVDVNGVPVYGAEGIPLGDRNLKEWTQEVEIELSAGKNTIQISALNVQGVESIKETLEIRCDAAAKPPELYLVVVGVSVYRDERYRLTYAEKDARDIATLLESKADRFGKVHVARFLNGDATRDKIREVKQLLLRSRVDDEVIIFLAGHGLLDERLDYYFATADIDFENPSDAGLPYAAVEDLLEGIPARKKLLLMDTCHSGEVDKTGLAPTAADSPPPGAIHVRTIRGPQRPNKTGLSPSHLRRLLEELFADLRRGTGAVVISAAGGAEFAIESREWQNGVFTYAVLDGLKAAKADADGDGQVQVSELRDYVIKVVPRLTYGRQTPTARSENVTIDFAVF
jgi:WD40 repeat protein/uncharacterized caspase-like protein